MDDSLLQLTKCEHLCSPPHLEALKPPTCEVETAASSPPPCDVEQQCYPALETDGLPKDDVK